jgi:hypothetical protein
MMSLHVWGRSFTLLLLVMMVAVAATVFPQQRGRGGRAAAPPPGPPHDPHDLSGIWLGRAVQAVGNNASFTPEGKAAFDRNKPSFGPRAVPPARGNDPLGDANPPGLPRLLVNHATKIQFIQLPDKMVQLIEWTRVWREIWTNGRPLPEDPDTAWYGYSVGRWEGDEFIVDTIGLDSRAWIDQLGYPKSEEARVQERYHRLDRDNLELTVTVTDPKMYTKPFGGDIKTMWRLQGDTPTGNFIEDIFAPIDEQSFNRRVRDPAGGVKR